MNIELLKRIRNETGYSISEIKEALNKSNNDYEKTIALLKIQFKNPDETNQRTASKGIVFAKDKNNHAAIIELIGETEFVKEHPLFKKLVDDLFDLIFAHEIYLLEDFLNLSINKQTISQYIASLAHQIGENVYLRRYERIKKEDNTYFSLYNHNNLKYACLLLLNIEDEHLMKHLPMHVVSRQPLFISKDQLDAQDIITLKQMYLLKDEQHLSFDQYVLKNSLYDQPFYLDSEKTVFQTLDFKQGKILNMVLFTLGEGIKNKLFCKLDLNDQHKRVLITPIILK